MCKNKQIKGKNVGQKIKNVKQEIKKQNKKRNEKFKTFGNISSWKLRTTGQKS